MTFTGEPGLDVALDQAFLLELAEAPREEPVGEAGNRPRQLAEAPRALRQAQTIAPVHRLPISSIAA